MTRTTARHHFSLGAILALSSLLVALCAVPTFAVTIPTVPVGNAGNAGEVQSQGTFGAVGYDYRIGTYEVSNAQYAEFLNAVGGVDTYALYNTNMDTSTHGGITRSGSGTLIDPYTYAVKTNMGEKPVNFVSWGDATRFSNWLHNGQPTGAQDASTTEDGAYTLNGAVTQAALNAVTRNAGATWWLPSEDEWYKAAYHKNDGVTGNYWDYPISSDTVPTAEAPPGGANSANFDNAVGTVTDVGAYIDSPSPYGTFDQGGNVSEWNEALISGFYREVRGGSWFSDLGLAASYRAVNVPTAVHSSGGFRVATVPEPSTAVLAIVGCALMLWWRKGRK